MKARGLLATLLAILALLVPDAAVAQTPVAQITAGSASGLPGATGIVVPMSLDSQGGAQVAGLNFDLTFDSGRLAVADVTIGSAASSAGKTLSWSQPSANRIRVIIVGFNQNAIPNGIVAQVSFNVLGAAAPGPSALTLSNIAATSPSGAPVTVVAVDGSFEVLAPPATDTPTSTATSTGTSTATNTPTTAGPTSTRTPTPTRTVTPTPTRTRTPGGPTDTPAPTSTRTLTPTVTRTSPPGAPTLSLTPTVDITMTPTNTPTGSGEPGLSQTAQAATAAAAFEAAVAGTATALAELDAAVQATATALAAQHPAPTPGISGPPARPDWAISLVIGLGALAILSFVTLLVLLAMRRKQLSRP